MYQFAYSAICEELPAPAALPPHCHLPDAIELIGALDRTRSASVEQLQALSDLRKLWLAIANDLLLNGGHELSELKADILAAAKDLLVEIERRRFKGPGTPGPAHADAQELSL
ncbi:MAG: hypothetical protein WCD20_21115 [Rhodomicrobium sp.]